MKYKFNKAVKSFSAIHVIEPGSSGKTTLLKENILDETKYLSLAELEKKLAGCRHTHFTILCLFHMCLRCFYTHWSF